jgi:hypothetical protein
MNPERRKKMRIMTALLEELRALKVAQDGGRGSLQVSSSCKWGLKQDRKKNMK